MAQMQHSQLDRSMMQPNWAAEAINDGNMIPGGARIDPASFPYTDAFTVTATAAVTAGTGVTIPVNALDRQIPAGTVLNFGSGKLATLTQTAYDGSMTLRADLAVSLVGAETAAFAGISGKKIIKAGTLVGRTWAERDSGVPFSVAADADEEIYLLALDVENALETPDCDLLRHNAMVRDHLLPGWTSLSTALKAKVRSLYVCVRGPSNV